MKINIYYGGRGLLEDPTLYVLNKLTEVLREIRVNVERFNLYEQKNVIATLPNTFKDADGVILACNLEWFGMGGYLQTFLDSCWLYGDKSKISKLYMFPVIIAETVGEKEVELSITKAWELLGGAVYPGITAYVGNQADFESDAAIAKLIEKKAEEIYRTISQKAITYPTSTAKVVKPLANSSGIELTPQESEQLSAYVSDDTLVKKQKADVEALSMLYKTMLDQSRDESKQEFVGEVKKAFKPLEDDFSAVYVLNMTDTKRQLILDVNRDKLKVYYGEAENPDVVATTTREVVNKLVNGRVTFQGGFMSGQINCKGDFKLLRTFDQLFRFDE